MTKTFSICPDIRGNQFIVTSNPENKYTTYHEYNIKYNGHCNWCEEKNPLFNINKTMKLDKIALSEKTRQSLFTIYRHTKQDLELKKKGTYVEYGKGGSCVVLKTESRKRAKRALNFIERLIGECK